jgi:hypothetical protein
MTSTYLHDCEGISTVLHGINVGLNAAVREVTETAGRAQRGNT